MIKNMGEFDRLARALLAIGIVIVSFLFKINGLAGTILLLLAMFLLLTNLVRFCPIYALFGISTKKDGPPRRGLDRP